MPTPFSSDDLGRIFEARTLTRGRSLLLAGAVEVASDEDTLRGSVRDLGIPYGTRITPSALGARVVFASECGCGRRACAHLAATALAALDRFPVWRKAQQHNFLANLLSVGKTRQKLAFLLEPAEEGAFAVSTVLEDARGGRNKATDPAAVLARPEDTSDAERAICRLLGGGGDPRIVVPAREDLPGGSLGDFIGRLVDSRRAFWRPTNKRIVPGPDRRQEPGRPSPLSPHSLTIDAGERAWYIDAATGQMGALLTGAEPAPARPTEMKAAAPRPVPPARPAAARPGIGAIGPGTGRPLPARPGFVPARPTPIRPVRPDGGASSDAAIVERAMVPVLQLVRVEGPDEMGRIQQIDALRLMFDYGGLVADADDERQFVRSEEEGAAVFIRRNRQAELEAEASLRQEGFVQLRIQSGPRDVKGSRINVFRGRDARDRWQSFVGERVPALEAQGWRAEIETGFGPRMVESIGDFDMRVSDGEGDRFSLDFGIEADGVRIPLLPVLSRLLERGGMETARIVDGKVHVPLDDGRILALPADRVGRMLSTMSDLIEAAERSASGTLLLPKAEAAAVLDLEELLTTRWQNAATIRAYVDRFRDDLDIEPVFPPDTFLTTLRAYQEQGLAWLQHLARNEVAGILADDMGLGKTAQTIAHIAVEKEEGRLVTPALIVVPTSLVANWSSEFAKFTPHLRIAIHHGTDRHERVEALTESDVVITTYTVLTRDIETMRETEWHLVVLDEAQAIKSPESKTTRAVCGLRTRHKLCLSGTPIENNLEELWSQFAFLMPGLLGERKIFSKRFRTPIEKKGDVTRRIQLARRIRPFILRRTKAEVATELPPKHTIVRRISLAPEQRELYETIRATLYDKVRHQIAEKSLARSRIVLLDALLKLRQVCCDPRLVKLDSAREVGVSSKLDNLMEMVEEMVAEGRRILLFSQFTSMLDLIKPALEAAGIGFVELRGDTADRATPVNRFEAGEVPVFLISLKAGGRGLNLISADTVIHYDPWWNPAAEDQASDRAYRIGQTKSVFVFKMIAADTVEERIIELQRRKAQLAEIALGGEGLEGVEFSGIAEEDIDYLFGTGLEPARGAA